MSFPDAVRNVLSNYANFNGRAGRSEFWFWALAWFLGGVVLGVIDRAIGNNILGFVYDLATLLPGLAVGARRLHDTDRSGWWLLLIIPVVIGWIVLLVFYVTEGTPAPNKYGPPPQFSPAPAY